MASRKSMDKEIKRAAAQNFKKRMMAARAEPNQFATRAERRLAKKLAKKERK